ncbi:WD repeat-containing protein 55 [Halotydeus destructor]|nr:WD repeat-containing protein 55 [Halotydeus destructor]
MPVTFGQSRTFEIKETSSLFDIAFHPSKPKLIAASTVEGHVLLLDGNQDSCPVILTLEKHHKGSSVRKVRFADEKTLVSAAKTVKIFDLDSSKAIRKLENGGVKIYSLLVVDNYLLCTGSDDGCFKLWDYRTPRGCVMELNECEDYISDMDIDSAKRIVVASSGEGTLSAFNVRAKRLEEPQSELFDAGFQAVRYLEPCNKVLAGHRRWRNKHFQHRRMGQHQ